MPSTPEAGKLAFFQVKGSGCRSSVGGLAFFFFFFFFFSGLCEGLGLRVGIIGFLGLLGFSSVPPASGYLKLLGILRVRVVILAFLHERPGCQRY